MSKLVRIVLIDSLCRGTKADLCLDGNTAIMGTNGIGKTSFMRLIPIFYGIKPGELISADSNKKSFADWYLPNPTSFIVFEYLNWESHLRCVVMHRSSDTYAYRFVKSGWSRGWTAPRKSRRCITVAQFYSTPTPITLKVLTASTSETWFARCDQHIRWLRVASICLVLTA